jgi:hypothetical protein
VQQRITLFAVLALSAAVTLLIGCSGSHRTITPPTAPSAPTPAAVGPIDPALVGNWNGTVDGSFGAGTLSMTLLADGSILTAGSGNYCAFQGRWGVTDGRFTGSGPDCTGTIVSLTAPASSSRLSGTWTASSGRSGTFTCAKE